MSSIPYSFHWVQHDKKKQQPSESTPATSATNTNQLKNSSFSWFNQFFQPQLNTNQQEYTYPNQYDLEFLHSIM
jgi:hypothetical protein